VGGPSRISLAIATTSANKSAMPAGLAACSDAASTGTPLGPGSALVGRSHDGRAIDRIAGGRVDAHVRRETAWTKPRRYAWRSCSSRSIWNYALRWCLTTPGSLGAGATSRLIW